MIGRVRGILVAKKPPNLLVEVGGVGYEVQVPMTTLFQLPDLGMEVTLMTHMVVREDAQLLYGFFDERDRSLFRQLIRVNGVGPKLALTILSGMDSASFARCVQCEDIATLVALPGVGKKTAERLLVEMRDKLKAILTEGDSTDGLAPGQTAVDSVVDIVADAEGALMALGYKSQEASRVVAAVNDDAIKSSEELIRRALKAMAGG
ncbi:MAG: Holliday junction branch migration protein RuvA [Halieaceae bacterium]|jgi:holliday junction DNA helicase RuvA|nr:Holliday junction branch migration protein RuvA [Halieaceae bacterium]